MKWYLTVLVITFLCISCEEDDPPPIRTDSFGLITMKVDGQTVVMKAWHKVHYSTDIGEETFSFQGASCDYEMELAVGLLREIGSNDILLGSFRTGKRGPACFKANYTSGDWHDVDGTVNITSMTDRLQGTFNFEAINLDGNTHVITDGSFDIEMHDEPD